MNFAELILILFLSISCIYFIKKVYITHKYRRIKNKEVPKNILFEIDQLLNDDSNISRTNKQAHKQNSRAN